MVLGLLSGVIGLDAAGLSAAASEADPAVEASRRGKSEPPVPVPETTTPTPPTATTTPPTTESPPETTTTTVTSAPAQVVAQETPPVIETPPAPPAFGGETIEAPPEPVQAPPPAPPAPRPVPVRLARTGDGGQSLAVLAGASLALGGAAIAGSAGRRRRARR